jgi:hypothetical protein
MNVVSQARGSRRGQVVRPKLDLSLHNACCIEPQGERAERCRLRADRPSNHRIIGRFFINQPKFWSIQAVCPGVGRQSGAQCFMDKTMNLAIGGLLLAGALAFVLAILVW